MTDNLGLTQKQADGIIRNMYYALHYKSETRFKNFIKANTEKWIIGIDRAWPTRENHRCVMIPFIGDEQMPDKNTFTKQIQRWGLLSKPNTDRGRWSFVQDTTFYFDHEVDAYKKALELTTPGHYIYKPIPIKIEAEIPEGE